MIEIINPIIAKHLKNKDELVNEGRKISRDIENVEIKIKTYENREKAITGKVKPDPEIQARGDKLAEEVNAKIEELNKIGKEIEAMKLAAIPAEMKAEHLALLKKKEDLERDRNKVALKIQKIKDRIIPMIQKIVKPLLKDEYDDIETAKLQGDKITIQTFNHVTDFKNKFKKR